jgi:hypothetical protein
LKYTDSGPLNRKAFFCEGSTAQGRGQQRGRMGGE